jgi:hypothetical protein
MGRSCLGAILLAWLAAAGVQASEEDRFLLGPPASDGPTVVKAGFYLSDVNRIDEENETFEFEGILTLSWRDERQVFDPDEVGVAEKVYQGNYQFSEVWNGWWPQVVLANESGQYLRQGVLLRIQSDGELTYVEELNAVAEMPRDLRRFPFDRQAFQAIFEVMGFTREEVALQVDSHTTGAAQGGVTIAQWELQGMRSGIVENDPVYADGTREPLTSLVVSIDLARRPGFLIRIVILPLALLVALSWSVFWMDRESLGERMDISFIGILTVVAFQIMVSGNLPRIAYFTLMDAFLYLNLLVLAASVVVNLVVGRFDRTHRAEVGDRIDRVCRWAFPVAYLGTNALAGAYFLVFH